MDKKFSGHDIVEMLKICTSRPLDCTRCYFCNHSYRVKGLDCEGMLMREASKFLEKYRHYLFLRCFSDYNGELLEFDTEGPVVDVGLKDEFVHVPGNVGDRAYFIVHDKCNEKIISEGVITEITCYKRKECFSIWYEVLYEINDLILSGRFLYGINIFLTEEEAKVALSL